MVDPEDKSIAAMVSKVERKRAELLTELEKVQEWLSQLDSILSRGKTIIGEEFIPSPSPSPSPSPPPPDNEKPETHAKRILRILSDKTHAEKIREILSLGKRMKLQEISDEFYARNWPINSKSMRNRLQVIKNNLVGKVGQTWFDYDELTKTWGLRGQSVVQPQFKSITITKDETKEVLR